MGMTNQAMGRLSKLLFGRVRFEESDEYQEFQFKFLCIVILAGAVLTGLLVLGSQATVNPINPVHVRSMTIFTALSGLIWWALRGHQQRYLPLAWSYEILCLLEYLSALYYVPEDEFRVVWFLTNIPGTFLLLGQRTGAAIAALTALGLAFGNAWLPAPYSPNALATLIASIIFLGVFFYAYGDRSISYYARLQASNRQLYQLAMHDQLTGVLNSRAYYQVCDQLIDVASRSGAPYSVLFIDLDHFKSVNDTYGHAAGDLVLKTAAQCIADHLRSSDFLGRIGGEEFSVFLPDTALTDALTVAEKIRLAIAALHIELAPDVSLKITASLGVAEKQPGDATLKGIQKHADAAMYAAKQAGRNRTCCFSAMPSA